MLIVFFFNIIESLWVFMEVADNNWMLPLRKKKTIQLEF